MKQLLISLLLLLPIPALAADNTIFLTLTPDGALAANKTVHVTAHLTHADHSPVNDAELELVHTQKFHLLIVDPTLTDYQHIHPNYVSEGVYDFYFTPKMAGGYRAWGDVTPTATGKQQYAMADLGQPSPMVIMKNLADSAIIGDYHFALSFDHPPTVGEASTGTLTVTGDKGEPVTTLSPVMGAYAHIVGFYDDFKTVVHVHPMGPEPTLETDHGGPTLTFHLEPDKVGFIKIFVQLRLEGHDVYVPFGVNAVVNK